MNVTHIVKQDEFEIGARIADVAEYQPGQQFDSIISWFVSPANFYLIPNNNADFRQLVEQIQSEYPIRKSLNPNDLSPNDHVVACDKENVIHRATVLRTSSQDVVVTFVDNGRTETVRKNQLWAINPDHCVIPKQAVRCSLYKVRSSDENGDWKAAADYDDYFGKDISFKATMVESVEQDGSKVWMVNLTDPEGLDVADRLVANNLALHKVVSSSEELNDIHLYANKTISVFTAAVESSKKFFVQVEPDKVDHIATYIQELAKTSTLPAKNIVTGGFCLAPFSDEALCRAAIMSVNPEEKQAHVMHIDYGYEYDFPFDVLKIMPDYLKTYNAQAVQCYLYNSDSFTDDINFVQNIKEKDLIIKVMDIIDNVLHVKLFDVNGVALPYPVESTETVPVVCQAPILMPVESAVVSWLTSKKPYSQRSSDQHAVNEMNNKLLEKYKNEVLEEVDVQFAKLHVAESGQFEAWYRNSERSESKNEVYGPDNIRMKRILNDSSFEHKITPYERSLIVPDEERPDSSGTCEMVCEGIPDTVFEDEFVDLLNYDDDEIDVYEVRFLMDPKTEKNRGIVFILFKNEKVAKESEQKLNNHEIRPGYQLKFRRCYPDLKSILFNGNDVHICTYSTAIEYCDCIEQMLKEISSLKKKIEEMKLTTSRYKIEKAEELNKILYAHHSLLIEQIYDENLRKNVISASQYALEIENDVTLHDIVNINKIVCPELREKKDHMFRNVEVFIASVYGYIQWPTPQENVEEEMKSWIKSFEKVLRQLHAEDIEESDIIVKAAALAFEFLAIHPFVEGNGRCSRIIFGSILKKINFPWIIIPVQESTRYFEALHVAHVEDDMTLWLRFICRSVHSSLYTYMKSLQS